MDSVATNIASLYSDEHRRLKRMLVRKGMSAQAAADAVQEAFIRLLRSPGEDIRDFRSYLRRTAETVAIDARRSEQRAGSVIDPFALIDDSVADPQPLPDAMMISREEAMALDAALLELSPRCREVLVLHKFEGLSYAEIADRLGIAKNTVMVHMVKAVGCLKLKLRENNARFD
ncbi:RNA polymerase sigma factor [Aquamicrobium lusatiense]|uniref:RNA polymerase sigma factor n=1 Tax=Aquamicrobium lusatiense TaxID=89772 RepID=UPI0024579BD9|nr:RNA polymerase sigma factor [Aquamicrobium lusatiense]MDH4990667.1 RNA polymerase sigma factor [Aquamicrobium lusatiense]